MGADQEPDQTDQRDRQQAPRAAAADGEGGEEQSGAPGRSAAELGEVLGSAPGARDRIAQGQQRTCGTQALERLAQGNFDGRASQRTPLGPLGRDPERLDEGEKSGSGEQEGQHRAGAAPSEATPPGWREWPALARGGGAPRGAGRGLGGRCGVAPAIEILGEAGQQGGDDGSEQDA
ncbi:MAG TPA: hypothetical protein VMS76_15165 [Planctomycetota bacterium]|nr:hypothetical protein [Planctomycetota bacterium]